jgi:hypothetical protein
MSHPEILLTTTGTIGLIFLVIFAGIIPICISAKATKDEEYDDEEDWMNALVGMYCFWIEWAENHMGNMVASITFREIACKGN